MASNMDAGSSSTAPPLVPEEDGLPPQRPRASWPRERLPPPRFGNRITVLSIDGGGIRGLIPAVVLQKLEEKLQFVEKEDDPDVDTENIHIADYFDVIAGTSTGGLIAAMLVTPDDRARPMYTAKEIEEFYFVNGPQIFPPKRWFWRGPLGIVRGWWGPAYDGTFLHEKIKDVTGRHTLADTVTNLVVPTFDVRRMEPIIFSSFQDDLLQINMEEVKPLVSDVCIGTSAAPTYFPAHHFVTRSTDGDPLLQFHLIDGGVAANNPTMAAISRVTREQLLKKKDFRRDGIDYKKYLVISIGTGSAAMKTKGLHTAESCSKWGNLNWIYTWSNGDKPIVDIYSRANDVLVDWHVRMLLDNTENNKRKHEKNYLRIQAQDPLFGVDMLSMDDASSDNMDKLVHIGEELLEQKEARVNLTTGRYRIDRTDNARTNNQELEHFARLLVEERKLRLRLMNQPQLNREEQEEAVQVDAADLEDWDDYWHDGDWDDYWHDGAINCA